MDTFRWDNQLGVWVRVQHKRERPRLEWERFGVVATREMRGFMRGMRAPLALFICTALAILLYLGLLLWLTVLHHYGGTPEAMARLGRTLFTAIVLLEFAFVIIFVPLLTAGAVAWEHQQHTIEGVLLTPLQGFDIAAGKLAAALSFFAISLCCMTPVLALLSLYGGVSLAEVLLAQVLMLSSAAVVGAFGILLSARFRDNRATVVTFLTVLALSPLLPLLPLLSRLLCRRSLLPQYRPITLLIISIWIIGVGVIFRPLGMAMLFALCSSDPLVPLALLLYPKVPFSELWGPSLIVGAAFLLAAAYLILRDAGRAIREKEI